MTTKVKERVLEILSKLGPEEQKLLSAVLRIERSKLYLQRPHLKEELLRAVRETVR